MTYNSIITAYYDRSINKIEGLFTIKEVNPENGVVVREFTRLPSFSGQRTATNTSWIRGKSPIPFSSETEQGFYYLWIDNPLQSRKWAGTKGIGAFYPISTNENDRDLIVGKLSNQIRKNIGWHPENSFKGSAGCIVSDADTEQKRKEIIKIWDYFDYLRNQGLKRIKLIIL